MATAGQTMARRDDVSVKADAKVVDDCRIAAAFKGLSLAEYVSQVLRDAARRDIDEEYARRSGTKETGKKGTSK